MNLKKDLKLKTILQVVSHGNDTLGFDINFTDGSILKIRPSSVSNEIAVNLDIEHKLTNDETRLDLCKCGYEIKWKINKATAVCPICSTKYRVETDQPFVYWLQEEPEPYTPWITPAR